MIWAQNLYFLDGQQDKPLPFCAAEVIVTFGLRIEYFRFGHYFGTFGLQFTSPGLVSRTLYASESALRILKIFSKLTKECIVDAC